jgi:hypothetical protein
MAKGDILRGTALWCKAVLKKPKNDDQFMGVDLALQEAVILIRKGKLDRRECSKADKRAEALLEGISAELSELERAAREPEKKAKTKKR